MANLTEEFQPIRAADAVRLLHDLRATRTRSVEGEYKQLEMTEEEVSQLGDAVHLLVDLENGVQIALCISMEVDGSYDGGDFYARQIPPISYTNPLEARVAELESWVESERTYRLEQSERS